MNHSSKILYGGLRTLNRELAKDEWRDARYTILVDENTFANCLPYLVSEVDPLQEAQFIEVPAGEGCKSLEVMSQVWQTLLEEGADRQAVLVCLGGGALCDLGGMAAASFKRGIRHILIPTSLLAMVDAAIGGKTAIDFGGVKNSIGFFYPASLTVMEPGFLGTLPQAEVLNGTMEMVKTAAVSDPDIYDQLLSTTDYPQSVIKEVARIKERVVKADPYDHGIRHILNFGHTFGHAVEVYSGLSHGVAVGLGMAVEMYLSVHKTGLSDDIYKGYLQWLKSYVSIPKYTLKDIEQMLPLMRQDKKNAGENVRCVLLQQIGAAVIDVELSDNEIRDAFLKLR